MSGRFVKQHGDEPIGVIVHNNHGKVKHVLSGGWHQWEGGGYKERV
jgi:hypothetical protein